jgi:hypothetical protein
MTTWLAEVQITLSDEGAQDLYRLTGIPPRVHAHTATASVRVDSDDSRDAAALALEAAARLLRLDASTA